MKRLQTAGHDSFLGLQAHRCPAAAELGRSARKASMEPIVTLPYSEWLVAQQLMKVLPASQGYSVYAPLSRQEKGVDLLLARRANGVTRAATLQVKYSRA